MTTSKSYRLPSKIEHCLAVLSKLYAQEGNRSLQRIIVNSQISVEAGHSYDNWNGGSHGHAVHLIVPQSIYLANMDEREQLQEQIANGLNKFCNEDNEFVDKVFLEMAVEDNPNWRHDSGLLINSARQVSSQAANRLWTENRFRLFVSHNSEVKSETTILKKTLEKFGVSAFVAHEDILPTKAWQEEVENALASMDGFVALMTKAFHDSEWTDQEVGYALARGVPIIAARLERDPYGFLAKFQALATTWDDAPVEIVKLLINNDRMLSAYICALRRCPNFDTGNLLSGVLASIQTASVQQISEIVDAFNSNNELRGSFGFNGARPRNFGQGLLHHLNRWGIGRFEITGPLNHIKLNIPDTKLP